MPRVDKLNQLLTDKLGVPSSCWWRDDINRRLDNSWNLKWIYPEILSGPDFLRIIIESGLPEHKERRTAAVRAFLRTQYHMDEEVRFKQVELQNKLLDLFVDVPITLRDQRVDRKLQYIYYSVIAEALSGMATDVEESNLDIDVTVFDPGSRWQPVHEPQVGAATLLLSRQMQQRMPHEHGAAVLPGQRNAWF